MASSRDILDSMKPWFLAPFLLGDLILLGAAGLIFSQAESPMAPAEMGAFTVCVALGACLAICPFVLRYRAELRLMETLELSTVMARFQNVEDTANHIVAATKQWQAIQDQGAKTVAGSREVAERIVVEQKEFQAFLEKENDHERQNLRLEVEKFRQAQEEWLQVLVRIMDHIYALYMASTRSGQPNLVEQLSQFQNACRDVARRVGFAPVLANAGEPFDATRHQLPDPETPVPEESVIAETLAAGFTFQGELLRPPVVAVVPATVALNAQSPAADETGLPSVSGQEPFPTDPREESPGQFDDRTGNPNPEDLNP